MCGGGGGGGRGEREEEVEGGGARRGETVVRGRRKLNSSCRGSEIPPIRAHLYKGVTSNSISLVVMYTSLGLTLSPRTNTEPKD